MYTEKAQVRNISAFIDRVKQKISESNFKNNAEIEAKLMISRGYLGKVLGGQIPAARFVKQLAYLLNTTYEYLVDGDESKKDATIAGLSDEELKYVEIMRKLPEEVRGSIVEGFKKIGSDIIDFATKKELNEKITDSDDDDF